MYEIVLVWIMDRKTSHNICIYACVCNPRSVEGRRTKSNRICNLFLEFAIATVLLLSFLRRASNHFITEDEINKVYTAVISTVFDSLLSLSRDKNALHLLPNSFSFFLVTKGRPVKGGNTCVVLTASFLHHI